MTTKYTGIGLRSQHLIDFSESLPDIGWIEVHTENFITRGGIDFQILQKIREKYPISLHGIGMSLGSATPLDPDHLQQVKEIYQEIKPFKISEHLSWSKATDHFLPDLVPFPFTEETMDVFARNIEQAQEYIGKTMLIENPSSYFTFSNSSISEPEFLNRLCKKSGCRILLDISNIYLSAHNNHFDPKGYIDQLNASNIEEIHVAGFSKRVVSKEQHLLIDSHDDFVHDEVWKLYSYVLEQTGPVYTCLEWDAKLPSLSGLIDEASKITKNLITHCKPTDYA